MQLSRRSSKRSSKKVVEFSSLIYTRAGRVRQLPRPLRARARHSLALPRALRTHCAHTLPSSLCKKKKKFSSKWRGEAHVRWRPRGPRPHPPRAHYGDARHRRAPPAPPLQTMSSRPRSLYCRPGTAPPPSSAQPSLPHQAAFRNTLYGKRIHGQDPPRRRLWRRTPPAAVAARAAAWAAALLETAPATAPPGGVATTGLFLQRQAVAEAATGQLPSEGKGGAQVTARPARWPRASGQEALCARFSLACARPFPQIPRSLIDPQYTAPFSASASRPQPLRRVLTPARSFALCRVADPPHNYVIPLPPPNTCPGASSVPPLLPPPLARPCFKDPEPPRAPRRTHICMFAGQMRGGSAKTAVEFGVESAEAGDEAVESGPLAGKKKGENAVVCQVP